MVGRSRRIEQSLGAVRRCSSRPPCMSRSCRLRFNRGSSARLVELLLNEVLNRIRTSTPDGTSAAETVMRPAGAASTAQLNTPSNAWRSGVSLTLMGGRVSEMARSIFVASRSASLRTIFSTPTRTPLKVIGSFEGSEPIRWISASKDKPMTFSAVSAGISIVLVV